MRASGGTAWAGQIANFVIDFAMFALFALWHWLPRKFGAITLDQVVFHLEANFGTQASSVFALDPALVSSAIKNVVIAPAVLAVILACLRWVVLRRFARARPTSVLRHVFLAVSVAALAMSCLLAPSVMGSTGTTMDIRAAKEDLFAKHYVAPADAGIRADTKRNLVVVYVESMEQSYADARAFAKNRIPHLTLLQHDNVSFGRFAQVTNTGWTIAGMVATMCGIPLKGIGLITQNHFDAFHAFLPDAKCLGDILRENGYRTEFLQGATLKFAAKDRFLAQHGFALIEGKDEDERNEHVGSEDEDSWRVHDDALFDIAKRHYEGLATAGGPFLLSVLTADTHTEKDKQNTSAYCRREHGESYIEQVECTDELVAGFVAWIQQHDPQKNTAIVVVGDHLVMFGNPKHNKAFQILDHKRDRAPFHLFVNPSFKAADPARTRLFTHYDLFPTMLSAAGFEIPGHRLGLGADLFASEPTLIERYGESYVNAMGLQQAGRTYLALWGLGE